MICYWSFDFDFRGGNVQANADTEPLSDVDEQPQERHVPWPQIFIIPRESVRSHVLAKLDIIDRIRENVIIFNNF